MCTENSVWMERVSSSEFYEKCWVCSKGFENKSYVWAHKKMNSWPFSQEYECPAHKHCVAKIKRISLECHCHHKIDQESVMSLRELRRHRCTQLIISGVYGAISAAYCFAIGLLITRNNLGERHAPSHLPYLPYESYKRMVEQTNNTCYLRTDKEYFNTVIPGYHNNMAAYTAVSADSTYKAILGAGLIGLGVANAVNSRSTLFGRVFDTTLLVGCSVASWSLCHQSAPDINDAYIALKFAQVGFLAGVGVYTYKKIEQYILRKASC